MNPITRAHMRRVTTPARAARPTTGLWLGTQAQQHAALGKPLPRRNALQRAWRSLWCFLTAPTPWGH